MKSCRRSYFLSNDLEYSFPKSAASGIPRLNAVVPDVPGIEGGRTGYRMPLSLLASVCPPPPSKNNTSQRPRSILS